MAVDFTFKIRDLIAQRANRFVVASAIIHRVVGRSTRCMFDKIDQMRDGLFQFLEPCFGRLQPRFDFMDFGWGFGRCCRRRFRCGVGRLWWRRVERLPRRAFIDALQDPMRIRQFPDDRRQGGRVVPLRRDNDIQGPTQLGRVIERTPKGRHGARLALRVVSLCWVVLGHGQRFHALFVKT